jgi:hypothetical protein
MVREEPKGSSPDLNVLSSLVLTLLGAGDSRRLPLWCGRRRRLGVIQWEQHSVDALHGDPVISVDVRAEEVGGALTLAKLDDEPRAFMSGSRFGIEVALLSLTGGLERPGSGHRGHRVWSSA